MPAPLDRRRFLGVSAAALTWAATGCSDDGDDGGDTVPPSTGPVTSGPVPTDPAPGAPNSLGAAYFDALAVCVLVPEMAAGPFPTREQLFRRDITEGYPGRPLRLGLRVVDAACTPILGAEVEVWHTDASGDYSSYEDGGTGKDEGEGTTFLRGTQTAGSDGIVEFETIYPGWYPGRAVHIHVRVRDEGRPALTTQVFFPDDLTAQVFATGAYAPFGLPDTTNATDRLGGDIENNGSLLHFPDPAPGDGELLSLLNLGVS